MRPSTIRFASAASAARRTLIPFASRAAAVRLTRASSLSVPNQRLIDPSRSVYSSVVIDAPFRVVSDCITCKCKYLISRVVYKVADASKIETGRHWSLRPAHGERAAGPARIGGVALPATSTRHAYATTRHGSRKEDRPRLGRFRRARSAGARGWRAAHDQPRGPGAHFAVGHDSPCRAADW